MSSAVGGVGGGGRLERIPEGIKDDDNEPVDDFDASAVAAIQQEEPPRPKPVTAKALSDLSEQLSQLPIPPWRFVLAGIVGVIGAVGTVATALFFGPVAIAPAIVTLAIIHRLVFSNPAANEAIQRFATEYGITSQEVNEQLEDFKKTAYAIDAAQRSVGKLTANLKDKDKSFGMQVLEGTVKMAKNCFAAGYMGAAKVALKQAQMGIDAAKRGKSLEKSSEQRLEDDFEFQKALCEDMKKRYDRVMGGNLPRRASYFDLCHAEQTLCGDSATAAEIDDVKKTLKRAEKDIVQAEQNLGVVGVPTQGIGSVSAGVAVGVVVASAQAMPR